MNLSRFAFLEDDLSDLRRTRTVVEEFLQNESEIRSVPAGHFEKSTIIVNHPFLQADDLIRFRTMLEIMGL